MTARLSRMFEDITVQGICSNPELLRAVLAMVPPSDVNDDLEAGVVIRNVVIRNLQEDVQWQRVAHRLRRQQDRLREKERQRDIWVREVTSGQTDKDFDSWYFGAIPAKP